MGTVRVLSSSPVSLFEVFSSPSNTERRMVIVCSFKFTSVSTLSAKSSPARAPVPAASANNARFNCVFAVFTTAAICAAREVSREFALHGLGRSDLLPLDEPGRQDGFATLCHFVKLKVVNRPDDTEEILDGLATKVFPLPRLNQTPHDWISVISSSGVSFKCGRMCLFNSQDILR